MENQMINPLGNVGEVSISEVSVPEQQKPKPIVKQKIKITPKTWNDTEEIIKAGNSVMPYDAQPVKALVGIAATQAGISRGLLMKSAYQEGMNKMLSKPNERSEAWFRARDKDITMNQFPVDGFYNYGLDNIGTPGYLQKLQAKGYLPKGFEQSMKVYNAYNEQNQLVPTAAFKNNQAALMAKAAMLRDFQDKVDEYATSHKLKLTPQQRAYFTSASYNGGWGNGRKMIDEYALSKDKAGFIEKGLTSKKAIHKNVYPRASELEKIEALFQ